MQTGDLKSWPRLYRDGGLVVTGLLNGAVALFKMTQNLFGPPPALAPDGYKTNPGWGEFFIEPGVSAEYRLGASASIYGGFSYVESSTRGTDNCCVSNLYYGNRELLFAGVRWHDPAGGLALDVSYGQQDFTVGNQMLIGRGADDGAQRGANQIGPRNAWANAGIVKATWQDLNVQAFYLKPNEAPSTATGTVINGINVEWLPAGPLRLGAMYLYVPDSNIVTRDQLNVYDLRARVHPIPWLPRFWLDGEYAWERKSGVAADGWYAQVNYNAQDTAWKPLVALRYASLSGDRPGSSRWEGFDPLYFSGSNPNWYQGRSARRFSTIPTSTRPVSLDAHAQREEHHRLLYLYLRPTRRTRPRDSCRRCRAGEWRRRAEQGSCQRIRRDLHLCHQQERKRECIRRLRGTLGGLQGTLFVRRRQRQRLVVSRRANQLQLLTSF